MPKHTNHTRQFSKSISLSLPLACALALPLVSTLLLFAPLPRSCCFWVAFRFASIEYQRNDGSIRAPECATHSVNNDWFVDECSWRNSVEGLIWNEKKRKRSGWEKIDRADEDERGADTVLLIFPFFQRVKYFHYSLNFWPSGKISLHQWKPFEITNWGRRRQLGSLEWNIQKRDTETQAIKGKFDVLFNLLRRSQCLRYYCEVFFASVYVYV